MRPPTSHGLASGGPSPESGFMLIGVVLFVVVLTILGLSLFGLSGFEAQFLRASNRRAESYYAAAAGVERARFVVIANRPKSEVRNPATNYPPGVTYSVAKQGTTYATADSNAVVNWAASGAAGQVWIRATANVQGEVTTLEQRFSPSPGDSIYERLFTLSGPQGLKVCQTDTIPTTVSGNRWLQTWLNGVVRTTSTVAGGFNRDPEFWVEEVGPSEAPDLGSYWAQHWATAEVPPSISSAGNISFTGAYAGGAPGSPRFFRTAGSADGGWSLNLDVNEGGNPEIHVEGTVIWMFERGAKFDRDLDIYGEDNDALLVMIAGPSDSTLTHPSTGLAFNGGLEEIDSNRRLPLILISNAQVEILHDHSSGYDDDGNIRYLSVFARNAVLMGPRSNSNVDMELRHSRTSTHDATDGVVYELVIRGLLPNTFGGTFKRLEPIAGTWIEIN